MPTTEVCHLSDETERGVPACGAKPQSRHPGQHAAYEPGATTCPICGRAVCPVCVETFDIYNRTGEWDPYLARHEISRRNGVRPTRKRPPEPHPGIIDAD